MVTKKSTKTARAKKDAPRKAKAAPAKPRGESGPLALRSASPSFTVSDLERSLAWYRDVLGFGVEELWKNDDGKVMGVSLKAGNVSFMIGQDDWKKGRDRKKGEGVPDLLRDAEKRRRSREANRGEGRPAGPETDRPAVGRAGHLPDGSGRIQDHDRAQSVVGPRSPLHRPERGEGVLLCSSTIKIPGARSVRFRVIK